MTSEQIIALIKAHQCEYTTEAEEQYQHMHISDQIADREYYAGQAGFAVAKAAALSRVLLELTDLDAAVAHLLNAETVMQRQRDREGLPPESEGK